MARFNEDYPLKANPTPSDRVWGLNVSGANNRAFTIGSILDLAGLDQPEPRALSVDLVITSDIAGTLTASWISNTFLERSVTDQALVFIGAPAVDNFRFDNILGNDDGTITVQAGTPSTTNPVIPTPTAGTIILKTILWNELGEAQVIGGSSAFPENRFTTRLEPGTNGKYAKIWEGNLSREQNFQLHILYGAPSSSQNWSVSSPGKSGMMVLNFLCDNSRNILTNNVQFYTVDSNSEAGDFVLVSLPGNRAAIFHKSTDFWMRMQFRIVFQNSAFRIQDFFNNEQYLALPSGTNWSSEKYDGGGGVKTVTGDGVNNTDPANPIIGFQESTLRENNTVLFDKNYIIGNAAARTGNILFDFTNAKLGARSLMRHSDPLSFSFPANADLNFELTDISTTSDNIYEFIVTDLTPSAEVVKVNIYREGGIYFEKPAGTATEGDVITIVSGVPTWAAPSSGGGGLWTDAGTFIYRDGKVVVGSTTAGDSGSGAAPTFTVKSKNTGAGGDIAFVQFIDSLGNVLFNVNELNANKVALNPSGTANSVVTIGNITGFSAARGLVIRPTSAGAGLIITDAAGTGAEFRIDSDGAMWNNGVASFGNVVIGTTINAWGVGVKGFGNANATRMNFIVQRSTGTVDFQVRSNGQIDMPNLPTADPAVVGSLWNDAGTLRISI